MTNETFMLLSDEEKNSKFKTVLRNKTDNILTENEVDIIVTSLHSNSQYKIHVYREPNEFCSLLILANAAKSKTLLGCAIPGIPGVSENIFCRSRTSAYLENKDTGIINIYIPQELQGKGLVNQ